MTFKTALVENNWVKEIDNDLLKHSCGWGNGYVIISKSHPLWGLHYEIVNNFVSVHGGLTFSNECDETNFNTFGLEESDIGCWIFGFDTAHAGDNKERWHKGAVQAEADFLMVQLVSLSHLNRDEVTASAKADRVI